MTAAEWEDAGGDNQWLDAFPPEPVDVELMVHPSLGAWVSPEGELFVCRYTEHEFMARRLCHSRGIASPRGLSVYGDVLSNLGWARIHSSYIDLGRFTQRQVDTLFDIYVALGAEESRATLARSIYWILDTDVKGETP
jgi:hypothetical protein